jgi:hypothetical protein
MFRGALGPAKVAFAGWVFVAGIFAASLQAEDPGTGKKFPGGTAPAAARKANPGDESSKFVRVRHDEKGRPVALQTAIVRYARPGADKDGLYVDLIGAIHIGDKAYYQQLNQDFAAYDALLYELVAPQGTRVPKQRGKTTHPVGMVQEGMTGVLDLDYQLDQIDYHKDNFVHADMSPSDFSKSMADRGESLWTMIFRMVGYGIAQQNKNPEQAMEARLLAALFDKDRPLALKRVMADQFGELEGSMGAFDGADGSTIITERNKVALEVLAQEIKAGKKHLGIFYGAGHLADMEKRLNADFGLRPQSVRWLTAWDLTGKKAESGNKKAAAGK